jgi:DNA-binding NtrC family response regulator
MNERDQDMRIRVLVVDPEPDDRWNLIYHVQCAGAQATGVASGRAGLASLFRRRPDVIISSLVLPDTSGLRILENAKNYWPFVRVILTAKWRSRALYDRVSRAGASDLIRHPVREREVLAVLARFWAARIGDEEPAL